MTQPNPTYAIALTDYRRKVYASWIGQCVGNMFGLAYENRFIDQPMPPDQDPRWESDILDRIRQADGAFSDDDTDIEYMYLLAMESCGRDRGPDADVTYAELTQRWMHHVRDHVWVANRAALGLMHHGLRPPATGRRGINPHYFQIDPQLVNEIWAVTAPGMVTYAAGKTAWAARIMADDWGTEPAVFYGAMYAAAYFEPDINRLIDIGLGALPAGARFADTVRRIRGWYARWPDNWRTARQRLAEAFYHGEDAATRTIWNANLNGACAILALLYGRGRFRPTLEMCCRIGFDTDNQAATMAGLVAIITGIEGIDRDLLYPLPDRRWSKPLGDQYVNRTRHDLPDASLEDQARRIAEQGALTVLRAGGGIERRAGRDILLIPADAVFRAPVEPTVPAPDCETDFETAGGPSRSDGLPIGWIDPATPDPRPDLSQNAQRIIATAHRLDPADLNGMTCFTPLALLADHVDTIRTDSTDLPRSFYGFARDARLHHYGYVWDRPHTIAEVRFRAGTLEETGGWFATLDVQVRLADDRWTPVRGAVWNLPYPQDENPLTRAPWVIYRIRFDAVRTAGVRIIGPPAGQTPFTSIARLAVYEP